MADSDDRPTEGDANLLQRIRLTAIIGLVSALLALLTGGVTLVFDLKPEWKPDPKNEVGATVSVRALDQNVQQGQYLNRIQASRVGCTKNQLRRFGTVVYVRAKIAGFKRSDTTLRWFTYDDHDQRLPYLRSSESERTIFKPQAPINDQLAQVWVPTPLWPGSYYLRFELKNAGVLLAFVDTKPFDVQVSPFESHDAPCQVHKSS